MRLNRLIRACCIGNDVLGTTLAYEPSWCHEVISIYYLNTGTRYQLTSSDYNVYYPLAENMITYVKAGNDNKRISYFKFEKISMLI